MESWPIQSAKRMSFNSQDTCFFGRDGEYQLRICENLQEMSRLESRPTPKSDSPIGTFGTCMEHEMSPKIRRVTCCLTSADHLKNSWLSGIQLKHDHSILIWDGFVVALDQLKWLMLLTSFFWFCFNRSQTVYSVPQYIVPT